MAKPKTGTNKPKTASTTHNNGRGGPKPTKPTAQQQGSKYQKFIDKILKNASGRKLTRSEKGLIKRFQAGDMTEKQMYEQTKRLLGTQVISEAGAALGAHVAGETTAKIMNSTSNLIDPTTKAEYGRDDDADKVQGPNTNSDFNWDDVMG